MWNNISLIAVRHGESEANSLGVISDKNTDHKLTAAGIEQAQETAKLLKNEPITFIVTSTRQRARLTATIINEYHGVDIIERDDLVERDFGVFAGISQEEAQKIMLKDGFNWVDIPESEKAEDIDSRVKIFLDFIKENYANAKILISTHSDIVKSLHRLINKTSIENSILIEVNNSEPHYFL